jgi:hypothetical protein
MPTVGRPSLSAALTPLLGRVKVVVVDDRPAGADLDLPDGVRVLRSWGGGPATARNAGWLATDAAWVAFLDDDVVPPADWVDRLERDLAACDADVGACQGRVRVPLPADRPPTDWERSTAGLETAVWATADMAYRRTALEDVGGFDERFPRAYREDADLGLRVVQAGWRIERGTRTVDHPVRPTSWRQSIRSQRGNADDVLMRALHGCDWRTRAAVPAGRRPWHLATTAALLATAHPRTRVAGGLMWGALTSDLARRRIAPGPRTPAEVATMAITSAVLPVAATWWWLVGWARLPGHLRRGRPAVGQGLPRHAGSAVASSLARRGQPARARLRRPSVSTLSVVSGVRCPVVSVAGTDPRVLAQFHGTTEFTVDMAGTPYLVRGCGSTLGGQVRFHEKDEVLGRDVRVWHVSQVDGEFVAEHVAAF